MEKLSIEDVVDCDGLADLESALSEFSEADLAEYHSWCDEVRDRARDHQDVHNP